LRRKYFDTPHPPTPPPKKIKESAQTGVVALVDTTKFIACNVGTVAKTMVSSKVKLAKSDLNLVKSLGWVCPGRSNTRLCILIAFKKTGFRALTVAP
jgi:hypothetical protein